AKVPLLRDLHAWSTAVAAGRQGDGAGAAEIYERHAEALPAPTRTWGTVQIARLLVTQAALRDGWGEPVPWLRELEASFFDRGLERVARDCRSLLGQAGEPVPRRRRGQAPVPPGLRALGITGREVEVLLLIAQRKTNREIADELFLSVRTVEHHIASLFTRTGVHDRVSLAEFAALRNA
ncbi:response regulator transcription factor, partial [Ilumatobacter sp.]|uniref:helix-turn-helix transcriptional regulator n=1 Tax=Ilumatobacter sp. TaxID=1967498 RepID=UPI003C631C50